MSPLWLVVVAASVVAATPLEELRQRCAGRRDGKDCLMSSLASYVEGVADPGGDVDLWTGLRVREVAAEPRVLEERPGDHLEEVGASSEALLGRVVVDKLWGVVQGRALAWRVAQGVEVSVAPAKDGAGVTLSLAETDTDTQESRDADVTGRRRRIRRRGTLSLLLGAAAVKLSAFGGLLLKGVALLVVKAILISKLALMVTLVAWAAKISSSAPKKRHVTYEVLSHPQKLDHGSGEVIYPHPPPGWGRSSHELVYSAHQQSSQLHDGQQ